MEGFGGSADALTGGISGFTPGINCPDGTVVADGGSG
jgi:hypothetical protein